MEVRAVAIRNLKLFSLIGFTTLFNMAFAQKGSTSIDMAGEENRIIAVTDSIIEYMIARDIDGLQSVLDEQFTLTHITGYVQSRSEWLSEIETEGMKYYSAKKIKHYIDISGDQAVVTLQHLLDARIWGSRNTWRLQQKMKLQRRNGQWTVINSTASTF